MQMLLLLEEHYYVMHVNLLHNIVLEKWVMLVKYSSKSDFKWNMDWHYSHISCFHSLSLTYFQSVNEFLRYSNETYGLFPPEHYHWLRVIQLMRTRNAENNYYYLYNLFSSGPANLNISNIQLNTRWSLILAAFSDETGC